MMSVAQLPFEQAHPLQAPAMLRMLRQQGPAHRVRTATGDPAWLVTGYTEVRALLDDPRLGRSHPDPDRVQALAIPLPVLVICELLGVPYADRDRFRAWTRDAADVRDRARSERGLAGLFGYGQQLVARKRAEPGDDVVSRLCATAGTDDDEIAMLSMFLLFAGHETTVTAISTGALLLLDEPAQWQVLAREPALVPAAVEEILRGGGQGGGGIPRYARTGLRIAGTQVKAGDLVLLDNGAANHVPSAFADPERFDVTRPAGAHLSFGHGARYRIGAPLARVELQVVFSRLVPLFPAMRLAEPVEQLTFNRDTLTGGLARLPVTWYPGRWAAQRARTGTPVKAASRRPKAGPQTSHGCPARVSAVPSRTQLATSVSARRQTTA